MTLIKKIGLYLKSFRMLVHQTEAEKATFKNITSQEAENLYKDHKKDYIFLDVRSHFEYKQKHIPGSTLIPIDELENRLSEVGDKNKNYVVYCAAGGRSAVACALLNKHGYQHLLNAPGMNSWNGPTE